MQHFIALIAFTPITKTLFRTTLSMMRKRGYPVVLHESDDTPSLYIIDTDNEQECEKWRRSNPILLAPVVLIGKRNYDLAAPHVLKPVRLDILMTAIMDGINSHAPRSTLLWRAGYQQTLWSITNPLASLVKPRVLVVGSHEPTRKYLVLKLAKYNIETQEVDDAVSALTYIKGQNYAGVFVGKGRENTNNYDFIRKVTKEWKISYPVILVSDGDPMLEKKRAQACGAAAYLEKPIDNEELQEIVTLLGIRHICQ